MPGLHHLHKRKRLHKKLQPYPHANPWVRFLDRTVMFAAIVAPFWTLPQIWKIYVHKQAAGVSALTFGLFAIFDIPWIIYGIVHKETPIIISYILWLIVNIVIVAGVFLYG